MASGTPSTSGSIHPCQPTIRKMRENIYELYRPATGSVEIEIIFFHGVQDEVHSEAYLKTWMVADDSECWLNTWLAQDFPLARILSLTYDSSLQDSSSTGRVNLYLIGRILARNLIGRKIIGQNCPVVLVGHGVGGLVLKQVCVHAQRLDRKRKMHMDRKRKMHMDCNPYKTFLGNMNRAFFFSTPISDIGGARGLLPLMQRGPVLEDLELFNRNAATLSSNFAQLRQLYGWKTSLVTVGESDETEASRSILRTPPQASRLLSRQPQYSPVEEEAARDDVDDFSVVSWDDNFNICKPRYRSSGNYQILVKFVREVLQNEKSGIDRLNTLGIAPNLEEALHLNSSTANRPADNHHGRVRSSSRVEVEIVGFVQALVYLCTSIWMNIKRFLVVTVHICTSLWMDVSRFLMETVDGSVILGVFVNTLSFLVLEYQLYIGIPFLVISLLLLIVRRRREAAAASESVGGFGSFSRHQRVL